MYARVCTRIGDVSVPSPVIGNIGRDFKRGEKLPGGALFFWDDNHDWCGRRLEESDGDFDVGLTKNPWIRISPVTSACEGTGDPSGTVDDDW